MAERKSGPVKPPVIELKAREAGKRPSRARAGAVPPEAAGPPSPAETPAPEPAAPPVQDASPMQDAAPAAAADPVLSEPPAGPAADSREAPPPPPPFPPPPSPRGDAGFDWPQIGLGAAGGAMLGLLLALLLAAFNLWPAPPPDPRLEGVGELVETLEATRSELAATSGRAAALAARLETLSGEADAARAALAGDIAQVRGLAEAASAAPPVDLGPLTARIEALSGRVDAVAAGASAPDAAALGETLTELRGELRALAGRADAFEARAGAAEQQLATLAAPRPAPAPPADLEARLRLPLLLWGLDSALATGRPFAAELSALDAVLPGRTAPPAMAAAAAAGLMRPDALAARFEAVLPAMLAARAGAGSGDWARDALDWGKALLALRPAGETAGEDPDAVIGRLEAAMDRQDFAAAAALFALLPEPMRAAAAEVPAAVAARAEALAFIERLRGAALAPEAAP